MAFFIILAVLLGLVLFVPAIIASGVIKKKQPEEHPATTGQIFAFWLSFLCLTCGLLVVTTIVLLWVMGANSGRFDYRFLLSGPVLLGLGIFLSLKMNSKTRFGFAQKVVLGFSAASAAGFGLLGALFLSVVGGMGWGRPLRIRGKIVRPRLEDGDEWCVGEKPLVDGVDEITRKALESLWLHDAQKEYASVPAFSRLAWQMISLGAPPDLIRDLHVAGLQEVDHTKKCFALASGFGQTSKTILPMPEIMHGFDNVTGEAHVFLATDSLIDGCLLEGFNADTAEESAKICQDPVSLKVIRQIAREERFHAELSWRVLEFCFQKNPGPVEKALRSKAAQLRKLQRPTAFSSQNESLVLAACPKTLIRFGRLPDSEFDSLWEKRVAATEERLNEVLGGIRKHSSVPPRPPELSA